MKRRTFIIAFASVLAGLTLPQSWRPALAVRSRLDTGHRALIDKLACFFSSPDNARAVGNCYLREYPERSDQQHLLNALGLDTTGTGTSDIASLRKLILERQQQDFIVGDTVMVNRWILSRTEASLCALVALS